MTKFDRWILQRLAKKLARQSEHHTADITEYYAIMTEAARNEFREDTIPGLNSFLQECHDKSLVLSTIDNLVQ